MRPPPAELVNVDAARARFGTLGDRWIAAMFDADPLADAVVADRHGSLGATSAVTQALRDGIGSVATADQSLLDFFESLDAEPAWVDHTRMDRAADALVRHTAAFGIALGAASLLRGAANTVAGKPLAVTGRYVSQPAVRSVEVGEWLRHVISPGGMRRDGLGFAYTVRVRIIHAHVRRGLLRSELWDERAWGAPIPQPYMAFTMAEFGHIALSAMAQLGVRFTDAELADIYHLWRYVGHVVGVEDQFNPRDAAGHIRIEELYRLTAPGPGADDRAFVAALTDDYLIPELARALPIPAAWRTRSAVAVVRALQRTFLGDAAADELGIAPSRLSGVIRRAQPVFATCGRLRIAIRGGRAELTRRGYRDRDVEMSRLRAVYGITHQLVDDAPTQSAVVTRS